MPTISLMHSVASPWLTCGQRGVTGETESLVNELSSQQLGDELACR